MAARRKWTYWHRVIEVDSENSGSFKVGQVVGLERKILIWHAYDAERRGFFVQARLAFLGKLPHDLHETDPKEANLRIKTGDWS